MSRDIGRRSQISDLIAGQISGRILIGTSGQLSGLFLTLYLCICQVHEGDSRRAGLCESPDDPHLQDERPAAQH